MKLQVDGILLLDKPADISSNGALQRVKHLFQAKKAGHTGSLDPIATGMLPICFGEATKFSQFLLESDKTYQVVTQLGMQTTTGDTEGEVVVRKRVGEITTQQIEAVFQKFLGPQEQIPPMYSAIKHKGKPLYQLARKGIEIERKPRAITLHTLELNDYRDEQISFTVHCTKGTYVRTLVEDIARALGTVAHVIGLRRTQITPYTAASMHTLADLIAIADREGLPGLKKLLLPVETSVQGFPVIQLSTSAAFYLKMGQAVRAPNDCMNSLVRLVAEDGKFIGMGEVTSDGRLKPHRLVA